MGVGVGIVVLRSKSSLPKADASAGVGIVVLRTTYYVVTVARLRPTRA